MPFYSAPSCLTESKQGQVKSRVFPLLFTLFTNYGDCLVLVRHKYVSR